MTAIRKTDQLTHWTHPSYTDRYEVGASLRLWLSKKARSFSPQKVTFFGWHEARRRGRVRHTAVTVYLMIAGGWEATRVDVPDRQTAEPKFVSCRGAFVPLPIRAASIVTVETQLNLWLRPCYLDTIRSVSDWVSDGSNSKNQATKGYNNA
jgi:hypothetical protein